MKVKKSEPHKFSSQELIAGKLIIDHQGREVSIPLVNLCTPAKLHLGRAIVLDTGLTLSKKSRVTVGFKRVPFGKSLTMMLNPMKRIASSSKTATLREPDESPVPPLAQIRGVNLVIPAILTWWWNFLLNYRNSKVIGAVRRQE